ncbi:MAG: zinc ribbon domain-containing protein [Spirochaetia bacterium]|nr:zinc ribbon domain-containing protein [Spirochaetia bacterium]
MPTYDYKCPACSSKFEKFHGISENPEIACPECGKTAQKQIGGGAGIHFKGTGFYSTDYKSSSKPSATAATVEKPSKTCAPGACGCA